MAKKQVTGPKQKYLKSVEYLASKGIDIESRVEIFTKDALMIASGYKPRKK